MPSKEKKGSYGGKSSFLKGKRVRKRGQISPVKNKKVGNRYQGEGGGGVWQDMPFPFLIKVCQGKITKYIPICEESQYPLL